MNVPLAIAPVRLAVASDLASISSLRDQVFPDDKTDFASEFARSGTRVWGAFISVQNACMGFLLAWIVVDEVHLHLVGVAPEARGRGIAKELLRAFLGTKPRPHDLACARLEVRRDNESALALYRSLGFRITNTRRRYYADGCDAFEMALPFREGVPVPLESDDP